MSEKFYLLIFSLIITSSCSTSRIKDSDEIVLNESVYEENGIYFHHTANHSKERYTGICEFYYYESGERKGKAIIKDGLPEGHWEYWNQDGSKRLDLYFKNGKLIKKEFASEPEISSYDVLQSYLQTNEIKPSIDSSLFFSLTDSGSLQLAQHLINWSRNNDNELQISINNEHLRPEKAITLNNVWGNNKDSVSFSNTIENVKYFTYNNRQLMVFTLSFSPCSGLGCSVRYFIIYDLINKRSNFFGTFRTGLDFKLHDFKIDKSINYLSTTYHGRNFEQTDSTKYELFSLNKQGHFQPKRLNKTQLSILNIYLEYQCSKGNITLNWFENIK